jgi:hypothetical protein
MPKTSVARGAIGRSSYEAVRKHIEQGKRATEAFALVAEASGRSKATVQTAYYRIARSLPDGGGVKLRPRAKPARGAKRGSRRSRVSANNSGRGAHIGEQGPHPDSAAALVEQLRSAAEALVAHVAGLETELGRTRADSARLAEVERALKR